MPPESPAADQGTIRGRHKALGQNTLNEADLAGSNRRKCDSIPDISLPVAPEFECENYV